MKKYSFLSCLLVCCCALISCNNNSPSQKNVESTTSGHITIAVDESLEPVIAQELHVFDSSYPKADISIKYTSEINCFQLLFKDSVAMIVVTRDLTKKEREALTQNGGRVRSMAIARGGIALVVNPASPDSLMTLGQLKSILANKFVRKYNVVFGNEKSGTVRYLVDSVMAGEKMASNVYAVNNDDSVLNYVATHKHALGILGAINIYQDVDTGAGTFKPNITVVSVRNDSTFKFYQPYQAYLALQWYPLTRQVYFISRQTWQGLATGFATFMANQRGQLIFKHAWMAPLRVPLNVRQVNLVH